MKELKAHHFLILRFVRNTWRRFCFIYSCRSSYPHIAIAIVRIHMDTDAMQLLCLSGVCAHTVGFLLFFVFTFFYISFASGNADSCKQQVVNAQLPLPALVSPRLCFTLSFVFAANWRRYLVYMYPTPGWPASQSVSRPASRPQKKKFQSEKPFMWLETQLCMRM